MRVRRAQEADVPAIVGMVRGLAEYERALHECELSDDQLRQSMFGPSPAVFGHVVEEDDKEVVGFAVWFLNYSTWTGRHGIYLEDLFVLPAHRGKGYGKALMIELARLCAENGYARFEWSVLDWNQPSIDFYKSLGATPMDEWTVFRLAGGPLRDTAASSPSIVNPQAS